MTKKKEPFRREPMTNIGLENVVKEKRKPDLPKVTIAVFRLVSGVKSDQIAGFAHYAKLNNMILLTIPEWQKEYENFLCKPVRS